MSCCQRLIKTISMILFIFSLSGCGHSKSADLYNSLPINTDGNPIGKIILVEFLDYSDPASRDMAATLNQLMEKRPNVRIVYHPIIVDAQNGYLTRLTLAASLQDRFLAAHHLMINHTKPLTPAKAIDLLSQAFIDTNELNRQQNGTEVNTILAENEHLAQVWKVKAVPTFFIGRIGHKAYLLQGPQTLQQLLAAIDKEASK